MILNKSCVFTFIIIALLSGCKTTSVVQPGPPVISEEGERDDLYELRGLFIDVNYTGLPDPDILDNNIRDALKKASEANFNVVFIQYGDFGTSANENIGDSNTKSINHDLIETLVLDGHQKNIKVYLNIDLLGLLQGRSGRNFDEFLSAKGVLAESNTSFINFFGQETDAEINLEKILSDQAFPYIKSFLKQQVKKIVESHDIDGIAYDLSERASIMDQFTNGPESGISGDERLVDGQTADKEINGSVNIIAERMTDLLEDLVVETMLVKPYLVNSIIYPGSIRHDFFTGCLENRIADFIVPKFNTNEEDLVDGLSELWDQGTDKDQMIEDIYPCFIVPDEENNESVMTDLIILNREVGSQGILFSIDIPANKKSSALEIPYNFIDPISLPGNLKKSSPFEVAGLNLSRLINEDAPTPTIDLYDASKRKLMDASGKIGIILAHSDSIDLDVSGRKAILKTYQWSVPYNYTIHPDLSAVREGPWVEFRKMPANFTDDEKYHLLCKTSYPASAWIDNDSAKVYKTGIFFKEITLREGPNRIRAEVLTQDSLSVFYEQEYVLEKMDKSRPAFPLWIDPESVNPSDDLELLSEDVVNITFNGSLGQSAFVELFPGGELIKCARKDIGDHSQYMAEIPLLNLVPDQEYRFILHLETEVDSVERKILKFPMENMIIIRSLDQYPLVKIRDENTRLTYNMGPIRLGGPIRSELGEGVMLKVNGKMGDHYRIRLDKIENSMVRADQVEILANETVVPSYYITNISCAPGIGEDIVSIPYPESVPYAIYPEPDQNRIVITLYGVKTSSTWITHRKGRQVVDKITWEQSTPDTYKVYINLNTSKIWGYDLGPERGHLILRVKHQPDYELTNEKPLRGLKIAVEAGHGGESTGAVGLSGLLEKDINLDLALKFGELCKSMGADVFQVRETDVTIGLLDKRNKAISADADILISIHANAAGTSMGYLRVPGTSTYYNNPFWAPLAETVYDRLLELGLAEFGVIGSFNYTVIRVSQMPAILVEQAFMTHAEDEEKLADPDFRQQMAHKIYEGLVDYLSYMENHKD